MTAGCKADKCWHTHYGRYGGRSLLELFEVQRFLNCRRDHSIMGETQQTRPRRRHCVESEKSREVLLLNMVRASFSLIYCLRKQPINATKPQTHTLNHHPTTHKQIEFPHAIVWKCKMQNTQKTARQTHTQFSLCYVWQAHRLMFPLTRPTYTVLAVMEKIESYRTNQQSQPS